MSTQTQRALQVTAIGSPLTLTTTHPIPSPGPNELLLKHTIIGLNPHDAKALFHGLFIADRLPAELGNDIVGTVAAVGSSVTNFKPGDHVFTQGGMPGEEGRCGLQEYSVTEAEFASKVPEGVSGDDAATLPTNVIASLVGLFDDTALGLAAPWERRWSSSEAEKTSVLIIGGGSNCGRFAVQLAKLAGIGKIVSVGGNEEQLKKFGVTHLVDRHGSQEEVLERIRKVQPEGFEYVLDTVCGPEGQLLGLNALTSDKKGKFARLLPSRPVDESKVYGKTKGFEVKNVFGSSHARKETCAPFLERVSEYLTEGKVVPLKYEVIGGLDADKVTAVLKEYNEGKRNVQPHVHIQG